jgi:hypothetical protein
MRSVALCFAGCVVVAVLCAAQSPGRDELLAETRYEENAKRPVFEGLTADRVADKIVVYSARNFAWFGFNSPEIRLVLPAADNSVYASVEFAEPTLVSNGGGEVPYELERGLYDHDSHHDELRLMAVEGDDPVAFTRARGTATIRYPLRIRTLTARRGEAPPDGLDLSFDGPYVEIRSRSGDPEPPEAASFTGINPFRVYDRSGRELERYPSSRVSIVDNQTTETRTYWGEAAEVETDVVDEWVTIRVSYDLPPVPPLAEERAGIAPEGGVRHAPTPGGQVEVEVVEETAGMVVARELGLTPDEAMERLAQLGYPKPSGDYMVMSALQGKLEVVELFLAAGFPIDHVGRSGTALLSAVQYGHADLVTFLIDAGADVNLADTNNATPLIHAADACDATGIVRMLLEAGADPSPVTAGGFTALQMAEMMQCDENAKLIRGAMN